MALPIAGLRLGDLQSWHVIEVRCAGCGHQGWIYPDSLRKQRVALLRRRGRRRNTLEELKAIADFMPITDLRGKLRCEICRNKRANSLRVVKLPR